MYVVLTNNRQLYLSICDQNIFLLIQWQHQSVVHASVEITAYVIPQFQLANTSLANPINAWYSN